MRSRSARARCDRIRLRGRLVLPAGDAVVVPELRAQGTDLLGADRAVLVEHGDRQGAFQLHVRHVVLEGVRRNVLVFCDLFFLGRQHELLIGGVPVLRPLDEVDDRTGTVLVDVGVHRLAAELGVCGFHAFLVLEHEDMPALLVLSDAARAQRGTGLLRKPGEGPLVSIRKIGQRAARSFPVDDVDPDASHTLALHVPDGLRVFLMDGMEPAVLVLVDVERLALAGLIGGGRLSGSFSLLDCRDILLGRNQAVGADGIDVGHIARALETAVGVGDHLRVERQAHGERESLAGEHVDAHRDQGCRIVLERLLEDLSHVDLRAEAGALRLVAHHACRLLDELRPSALQAFLQ